MTDRRTNTVGLLLVSFHAKYGVAKFVPALWVLLVVLGVLQVLAVSWG